MIRKNTNGDISDDEFKQFIEVEADIKWQATFRILYYCGLRKGELRGLQWKDIDLERKNIKC